MTHFKERSELFQALVTERGWSRQTIGIGNVELVRANGKTSREEALDYMVAYRKSLCASVAAEFQARHSAFSAQGAKAYCDNWN